MPHLTTHNRRELLKRSAAVTALLAGAGLLAPSAHAAWTQAAFEAKTLADAVKALGGAAAVESKDVTLVAPEVAENGAVVQIAIATALSNVKRMLLLVEKNPAALSAAFDVTDAVDASFTARVKMGQSSNVMAVAMMGDGRVLFAQREVKVTLGGCGG